MKRIVTLIMWGFIVSGCTTVNPEPKGPTIDKLILVGERMLGQMLTDRQFLDSYPQMKARAKQRGDSLPVIVVERVVGNMNIGISDYALAPVRDRFRVALRKTGMFTVKDNALGSTVDYGLSGDLATSDKTHHFLRLRLIDYADDCKEIWNEFQRVGME